MQERFLYARFSGTGRNGTYFSFLGRRATPQVFATLLIVEKRRLFRPFSESLDRLKLQRRLDEIGRSQHGESQEPAA